MNDIFSNPHFTKQCSNCSYATRGWLRGFNTYSRCNLSSYYCTTERSAPSVCGLHYENWKPHKSAMKEAQELKDEFPEFFI